MRELGIFVSRRLGYGVLWVYEDLSCNCWKAEGFPKVLIKIGLVTALGVVEGCLGFHNGLLKLLSECSTIFYGWWRPPHRHEVGLRGGARQHEIKRTCDGGAYERLGCKLREGLRVFSKVLGII